MPEDGIASEWRLLIQLLMLAEALASNTITTARSSSDSAAARATGRDLASVINGYNAQTGAVHPQIS